MTDTLLQVLRICAPLFALIVFGVWLRRSGLLSQDAQGFITRFVYRFSLPVLIYTGIVKENFRKLLNPAVIGSTLTTTFIVLALAWLVSRVLPARLRGPAMASSFIANTAYIGFPLSQNAFGDSGLTYASIVNAFTMPVFIILGVWLLTLGRDEHGAWHAKVRTAVTNPIVMSALIGLLSSLLIHETPLRHVVSWRPMKELLSLLGAIVKPLGIMGLPLALIAVGASLRFDHIRGQRLVMGVCTAGKLIVTPLVTWLACRLLFADAEPAATGTAVLLMACPQSVGLYVISKELKAEPDFMAGMLVLTTLGACITIPLWVALVVR
jgi:malonate transporter